MSPAAKPLRGLRRRVAITRPGDSLATGLPRTNFRSGNQVHVSGMLNTCSAEVARVTASEVKVQKP